MTLLNQYLKISLFLLLSNSAVGQQEVYIVQKGDTLQSISKKLYNDDRYAYEIAVINGIKENVVPNQGVMLKIIRDGVYIEDKSIYFKPDLVN